MDNARQQIVDSIKANSNILVTVSTDPTVDELAAALGLAMLLNKIDKRATAVVSGTIPPAIDFLEPGKTFENTADSLRDFIIALDKEKADHLRYKVDGDVVKIFITPYKTTLTQNDLDFSQGDYNVELVIAIGVKDQDHLDKALAAHGKILHDASVVTITAGNDTSNLGSVDWHDGAASSLSEMMVSLTDGMKEDKPLLDEQISSAYLTGIVSATDRFSNDRTSSRVMTMAAQLMAAGANQQLIAAKLEEAHDIGPNATESISSIEEKVTEKSSQDDSSATELTIDRSEKNDDKNEDTAELSSPKSETTEGESTEEQAQRELEEQLAGLTTPPAAATMEEIEKSLQDETPKQEESPPEDTAIEPLTTVSDETMPGFEPAEVPTPQPVEQPAPEPAAEPVPESEPAPETSQDAESAMPQIPIINEHGTFSDQPPAQNQSINSIQNGPNDGEPSVDPFTVPPLPQLSTDTGNVPSLDTPIVDTQPTNIGTPEGAVMLGADPVPAPALAEAPPAPVAEPAQIEIPAMPPLPPLPLLPTDASLPPLPPPPPLPDFSQPAAPLSGAVTGDIFGDSAGGAPATPAPAPAAPEPGQFRIPGQS